MNYISKKLFILSIIYMINFDKTFNNNILILQIILKKDINDNDLASFIKIFNLCLEEYNEFKCIFDLTDVDHIPMNLVFKFASYLQINKHKTKKKLLQNIIITDKKLVKNVIDSLFKIVNP